jgi:phosphatidylglycerophosphate synthase
MSNDDPLANRRPLKSRGTNWARGATIALLRTKVTPDQISVIGIFIACAGAWAFVEAWRAPWLYLLGALGIQLRLLCNMLDGLVAVEGGRKSAYGPLFNEVPDRIQDSVLLIAAGHAAGYLWLGFLAALLAAIAAYVRLLGGTFGFAQDFCGPMAKPHRMAALTLGAVAACIEAYIQHSGWSLLIALSLIAAGTLLTIARRLLRIGALLKAAA